jgi:hypothetical protein
MNFLSNYQKKERWAGDISQHDEDGWMFYPDRLCFDDIPVQSFSNYLNKQLIWKGLIKREVA